MQDPQKLIERFQSRVHVVDGGLATELEKRGHDISGKLWSARVLLEAPGAIEQLHYDYLKAGADIIITSSYQLTFQGMKEAGYTHEQAEDALWKSVEVAVKARDRYLSELDEDLPEERKPLIAASIGPYGAYLADGSEYTGVYELERARAASGVPSAPAQDNDLVLCLTSFHWKRVTLLAQTHADFIAFETIPTYDELVAISNVMMEHNAPFWTTCTVAQPDRLRDDVLLANGVALASSGPYAVAVGVNCSAPPVVADAIRVLRETVDCPVVVYPNSGEGWDAEHRCWVGENDADHFAEHAREWIKAGANIIGGCCRTGPEHIAQLRALVDSL